MDWHLEDEGSKRIYRLLQCDPVYELTEVSQNLKDLVVSQDPLVSVHLQKETFLSLLKNEIHCHPGVSIFVVFLHEDFWSNMFK
jgi:hypothetical protein